MACRPSSGGLSLTGSGFQAKGINPFFTNNLGEPTLRDIDSDGYLLQGSYSWGKNRVALSYGKTEDDGNGLGVAADYETRGIAYFRTINDNLKLVAEYNQYQIDAAAGQRSERGHRHLRRGCRTQLVSHAACRRREAQGSPVLFRD
jgi:hypothetical protein